MGRIIDSSCWAVLERGRFDGAGMRVWACILLLALVAPAIAFGAQQNVDLLIERAEEAYQKGEEALSMGQRELARKFFLEALSEVRSHSQSNSRIEAYWRELVERINKLGIKLEESEPSPLDELSKISEAELAAISPDGVKIFGSYDFDFSVAEPVFQFINYFVSGRGRAIMEAGLQRSGRYRAMAERIFKQEGVPLDLVWLAQAESFWNPRALSRAGAKGIWQFVPATASRFGLMQNFWVDERAEPEKSTRAAARYLRWLHEHFAGDWLLAMAAYNAGEARVDDAIARCGFADFWELYRRRMLPEETRNYVPIILSIMIISKNQKRYGFDIKPDPPIRYDTFELPSQTDLKVVAELLGAPYEAILELNPELRFGISPPNQPYTIKIPEGTKESFAAAFSKLPESERIRRAVIPSQVASSRRRYAPRLISYRARRGDTLISISRRYGVSMRQLARLNRLRKGSLRHGQLIRIPLKRR